MEDTWDVKVTCAGSRRKPMPWLLAQEPSWRCRTQSHPAALPAGRKVLSSSCQKKRHRKGGYVSPIHRNKKLLMKNLQYRMPIAAFFARLLTDCLKTSLAFCLISFRALYYPATTCDLNQNNLRLIHLSRQS